MKQEVIIISIVFITSFNVIGCDSNPQPGEPAPIVSSYQTAGAQVIPTPGPTNTPLPTVVEPGLAYGLPCKPPCWRGITPGQSSGQETEQAMEELRRDNWATYIDGNPATGYFIQSSSSSHGSILVAINNNLVTDITGSLNFDYTAQNLVEDFGYPEGVYLYLTNDGCTSCEGWETSAEYRYRLPVYFLYPSQGLLFLMLRPHNVSGCLCPEMKINRFCYYRPLTLSEALNNNYLADLCGNIETLKNVNEKDLTRWHGFGEGY